MVVAIVPKVAAEIAKMLAAESSFMMEEIYIRGCDDVAIGCNANGAKGKILWLWLWMVGRMDD